MATEHELQRLSDDELVAFMRAARGDQARLALRILVFGYWAVVLRRVGLRVPREHVEDVAADVIESAVRSAFDGESVGEFRSWLWTILDRRVADFHRRSRLETEPLVDDSGGVRVDPAVESETGAVEAAVVVREACSELSDAHLLVVDLFVFGGVPASETAGQVNARHPDLEPQMTENNVHAIASRFRRRVRSALEGPS